MARLIFEATVTSVTKSKKEGNNNLYYGLCDVGNGGLFSIAVDGGLDGVKPGSVLKADIEVLFRTYGLNTSLTYVAGSMAVKS